MTEPIQFGAAAVAVNPVATQEQSIVPTPEPVVEEAQDATQDAEELVHDGEQAVQQFEQTHATVLTDLMTKLEGIAHLGKSEIVAIVNEARTSFEKL